ncbi:hypothetical protein ACFVZD_15010 [Streptomyces sp. NPDC058287]|uniref:hypothetical protein n=1 Tax=unclassified Streptomyces TaxID=2593676 RepID=UPI0036E8B33A
MIRNSAVLDAIEQWETARNVGAFTDAQQARLRDLGTNWHLSVVTPGKEWSLEQVDASGSPVGSPERVTTPSPALTGTALPTAHAR